jgi:hypothetical protein
MREDSDSRVYVVRLSNESPQAIRSVNLGLEVNGFKVGDYNWGVVPPNASGVGCEGEIIESVGPHSPLLGMPITRVQEVAAISLSFVDASGLRWRRTVKGELRLLYDMNDPPASR